MTTPSQDICVPSLGESISEATLARWLYHEGDVVTVDALLAEIETDKITLEITAPFTGILGPLRADEGAQVRVGDVLTTLCASDSASAEGTGPSSPPDQNKAAAAAPKTPTPSNAESSSSSASASAPPPQGSSHNKQPSQQKGNGTTPAGTAFISKDEHLEALLSSETTPIPSHTPSPQGTPSHEEERVPMSRLRQRIAEQLKTAQNTAALLTTFNEVNMAPVMAVRSQNKEAFEARYGCRLGFMSFFVKAAVKSLRRFPILNAELQGRDIVFKNYYHIGVAVGTDRGLVVPTLKHAETMDFATIEKNIAQLAGKAKNKQLMPQDLADGTFTISNGGVYGSLLSTPIINPPQSAILGLHSIQKRPMAEGDQVVVRPMMYLALSYDHRIIDGKDAVGFLKSIKETIENPSGLLLDL